MSEPRFCGEVSKRSHYNMSKIHGKDTSIEIILRKALWAQGIRYRKNYKGIPGSPDIAITKYKIAIFCDSEFFHGKDWEVKRPKIQRDIEKDRALENLGWRVIHFWGKDITKKTEQCVRVVEEVIFDVKMEQWQLSDKFIDQK